MIFENVLKYTLVTNTEERNSIVGLKISGAGKKTMKKKG